MAADVYAFGIVLWELLTWQVPWDDYNPFQVSRHFFAGKSKFSIEMRKTDCFGKTRLVLHKSSSS